MRILVLLVVLTACGTQAGAPDRACTEIGTPVGIGVRIAPSVAARFTGTTSLEACWNGACHTYPVALSPETTATGSTCTGTAPDDTCTARMRETGGKTGFANVPGLPAAAVRVTFSGETVDVTPKLLYPNGPDCGAGGPQANLVVDAQGVR
ncbi:hypothetical protein LWP59_33980 [Amycolatopsis acidiphila]|uniref:Uncharacterized protein n=1 Tax=Amycolatopsis acidiphila TaxID=715473 RepID=A0A558A909_9PSEU|nr:hypothetical protein [Amycolatopsis acidiphila]TVT20726.1 hypothetical protein FNH06_19635 [Amycolatopsis acidiphila]UIJ59028.1 hypothetical protein LWP59_33980 [Amycolatopsis acidiphila]GHG73442.1 hypothetical protein GCM10017788_36800 [Amycolatopsis acidiphila]